MKKMILLLSFMLFGQAQATGYFRSGDDLLGELSASLASRLHVDKSAFAKGYVAGVADATSGLSWCSNSQVNEEQIYKVVTQFMKSHPDSLNRGAASIVGDALAADFPCHKK